MTEQPDESLRPTGEQITYANILFFGAWAGIFVMVVTYLIYVTGVMSPHVDLTLITQNWDKGVDEYLEITHSPHGWGWAGLLNKGDFLNYLGLVFLALLTIICYLVLIPGYAKRKDWAYFVIVVLEIVVLAVAASGILGGGGH